MTAEEIADLYRAGATLRELAAETGWSIATIVRHLKALGEARRPAGPRPGTRWARVRSPARAPGRPTGPRIALNCQSCGGVFEVRPSGVRPFCSKACAMRDRSERSVSASAIRRLLADGKKGSEIAAIVGCTPQWVSLVKKKLERRS